MTGYAISIWSFNFVYVTFLGFFFFLVLGMEPRSSGMLGKCSAMEPYPQHFAVSVLKWCCLCGLHIYLFI
jgi:hypothetical protein